jgi:hypothetical protein
MFRPSLPNSAIRVKKHNDIGFCEPRPGVSLTSDRTGTIDHTSPELAREDVSAIGRAIINNNNIRKAISAIIPYTVKTLYDKLLFIPCRNYNGKSLISHITLL